MQAAASPVAARMMAALLIPASAINVSSKCSKYPWNRPGGPVSVPIAMRTPPSDSIFKFCLACSSAALYACAARLRLTDSWRVGSRSAAMTCVSAAARKNGSSKKSGALSYTNVDTSRMSVGQ